MNRFKYKTVVVPWDFSMSSTEALAVARDMVGSGRPVHVIHVTSLLTSEQPGVIWATMDDETRRQQLQKSFFEHTGDQPTDDVQFEVRFGDPGSEIVDFAEQVNADLIVMPSHGRSGLQRLLLGSVAERVLRLSHCPVLVLKSCHDSAEKSPT